ncbi:RNA polymerase sigma factor [Dyadobacter fanqingshengii]|uniref:Sigma-70 family RNA polymerase sigma factor n=1 Tax=Dyadobacter fanqingshengii TaxID=2906443 RepID=A0A9X1PCF5_9BACT|nr:sigma-70 family RNA polymerase sigma factor [Dyadobacter fanqingshengii]MCF0041972.1 sigma-70 family RNA polymerase sigma factor [Dyadobacter fanqingshengii]USJ36323.1 sigma-70 family RNA polymerase sigma factor [Dyadobacter fanqingshengii]
MVDNLENEHLIEALQEGSENAFTVIYQRYWYKMFLVAYRKLQDKEAAEEIIQDIFLRLWKERITAKINNLDHYLFAAVRYEVINHIRSNVTKGTYAGNAMDFDSLSECNTENQIALKELLSQIEEGLHILPGKSGEIFRLYKLEHWPISRIAKHFDLSEKAIEYHLTKATKSVRNHLKQALYTWLVAVTAFFFQ